MLFLLPEMHLSQVSRGYCEDCETKFVLVQLKDLPLSSQTAVFYLSRTQDESYDDQIWDIFATRNHFAC